MLCPVIISLLASLLVFTKGASVQGRTYLCKKLDLSSRVAVVRPADLKYYTKTRDFCDVHVIGGRTAYAKHSVHPQLPS